MDFKTGIQDLIKQGKSFDEISKMFENDFNSAMVAASEESLDAMYEEALDALDAALENDTTFTKEHITNAAVCWAIETHDDWGKEEIDLVKDVIATAIEVVESGIKTLKPLFEQKVTKDKECDCACSSNAGDFGGKVEYKCTDAEALKKFLATL